MNWLKDLIAKGQGLFRGADWKTWLGHATVAVAWMFPFVVLRTGFVNIGVTVPDLFLFGVAFMVAGYYTIREIIQYVRHPDDSSALDRLMDIAVPFVVAFGIAWIAVS